MKITKVLGSLALVTLGGVAGYFIAKKTLAEQYKEDLLDVQDFYYKKLKELGVMDSGFTPDDLLSDEEVEAMIQEQEQKKVKEYDEEDREHFNRVMGIKSSMHTQQDKGRPIINYNKPPMEEVLARNHASDMDEGDEEIEDDPDEEYDEETGEYRPKDRDEEYEAEIEARAEEYVRRKFENKSNGLPYVISHEEYMNEPPGYDKQVLYYYANDRVLCEDDDSLVEDEEALVGFDYEDVLDMQTMAWVRNDVTTVLYEIHRIDDSYAKAVQGIIETPRERDFRIKGRRKQAIDDRAELY